MAFRISFLITAISVAGCGANSRKSTEPVDFRGYAMGTTWQVILPSCPASTDVAELDHEVRSKIEQVESQMSHWRDDSLVSQFNRSRSTRPFEITAEMAAVIKEAQRTCELTEGAFDITAAPLVNLWGFGPPGRPETEPTDEQIEATLLHVGSAHLRVNEAPDGSYTLSKHVPELQIDLSALAKGYAIDLIAEHLDARQVEDYLIELGGELRARGTKANGGPWQVGLEHPDTRSIGRVRRIIALRNQAVATSGGYRNFIVRKRPNGDAYSHIIDPRTGRPVTHDLVSLSVIDPSAMRADAWATALMVLGPGKGFETAKDQKIATTFIINKSGGLLEKSTELFDACVSRPRTVEKQQERVPR